MVQVVIKNKVFICNEAKTQLQIMKGLMFQKEITPLLFTFKNETKTPFHTLFMKHNIAMVFIDKNLIVNEIIKAKKNRLYFKPKRHYMYVLEIKENHSNSLNIGDSVTII